ncbi:hypothetical protein ACRRTK_006872 [Alexandromys fortis]
MLPGLFSFAGPLPVDSWCLVLQFFILRAILFPEVPWAEILQSRKQVLAILCKVF